MPCSSCANSKTQKSSKSDRSDKSDKCGPEIHKYYPDDPGISVFVGFFLCNLPAVAAEGVIVLLPNGRVYQQLEGSWIQLETGKKFFFGDLITLQVFLVRIKDCDKAKINILLFCAHYQPLAECGGREYYTYIITDECPQCALTLPEATVDVPADHQLKAFFK
jgi:hypothetical protein